MEPTISMLRLWLLLIAYPSHPIIGRYKVGPSQLWMELWGPYKQGYSPSYPFIMPFKGVIYITPFITSRGPPCRCIHHGGLWVFVSVTGLHSDSPIWMKFKSSKRGQLYYQPKQCILKIFWRYNITHNYYTFACLIPPIWVSFVTPVQLTRFPVLTEPLGPCPSPGSSRPTAAVRNRLAPCSYGTSVATSCCLGCFLPGGG